MLIPAPFVTAKQTAGSPVSPHVMNSEMSVHPDTDPTAKTFQGFYLDVIMHQLLSFLVESLRWICHLYPFVCLSFKLEKSFATQSPFKEMERVNKSLENCKLRLSPCS